MPLPTLVCVDVLLTFKQISTVSEHSLQELPWIVFIMLVWFSLPNPLQLTVCAPFIRLIRSCDEWKNTHFSNSCFVILFRKNTKISIAHSSSPDFFTLVTCRCSWCLSNDSCVFCFIVLASVSVKYMSWYLLVFFVAIYQVCLYCHDTFFSGCKWVIETCVCFVMFQSSSLIMSHVVFYVLWAQKKICHIFSLNSVTTPLNRCIKEHGNK